MSRLRESSHGPLLRVSVGYTVAALVVLFAVLGLDVASSAGGASACTSNPIVCENALPGSPASEWDVPGDGDPTIQGFATQTSVNVGSTISFKIKTDAAAYHIDIYRMGYYGGLGARFITTIQPSASLPQTQPACISDSTTHLYDCGNWGVSASWQVPSTAVSGVYIAHLVRPDRSGSSGSHIIFVVRNDGNHSDLVFQTSDETWQAYNDYGGYSLYPDFSLNSVRAYKVSYNRPYSTRDYAPYSYFFGGEYPMVRWLERNGYDVSYISGVDTASRGSELLNHKVFLSVGHDEYWSGEQRTNVENARAAGVNLGFFSGNASFWKTRWENSIDGSNTPMRTLVCYKETRDGAKIDPSPVWTGTWRDARFSPPADGGRPENALMGTLYKVDAFRYDPITVSAADGKMRFWRNTSIANLAAGSSATLPAGVLGYEWDVDDDNGFRPPGLIDMSSTTISVPKMVIDQYGQNYDAGTATHSLTLYRAASGALVFGAGTVQWSWGLDDTHADANNNAVVTPSDPRMQQATLNLLADMGVQPGTMQTSLIAATKSTDTTAPTTTITSPTSGAVPRGSLTVTGTAADSGGGIVAGVEVSTDGGTVWHKAQGRTSWSYSFTPPVGIATTVKVRSVDDSANIGTPASVTVTPSVACPCSVWSNATMPTSPSFADAKSYELGMRFRSTTSGYVTGVRFYKGTGNTGTHLGHLWTNTGTLLATATFTNETASGWQQASFPSPVPITANTTYVISYYAPAGNYALDRPFFTTAVTNSPLIALADGTDGANGIFKSGTSGFPTQSQLSSNYWVDVVFDTASNDTTPPHLTSTKPASGATGVGLNQTISAAFDEPLAPGSVTTSSVQLSGPSGLVPATVAFDGTTNQINLTPSAALTQGTVYTATVHGGAGGVTDIAGNPFASDYSWSFTTFSAGTCPCTIWPNTKTPGTAAFADSTAYELGVKFRSDMAGFISGIRFYKGAGNTGTHIGHLWSSTGTLLGQVTFTGETATGWQQANFAQPIAILANTTYIASYWDPNGNYALDRPFFTSSVDSGVLHALADGFDGGNGVLNPGTSAFPTRSTQSSNYWVDVVFATSSTDKSPPTVVSTLPANGATGVGLSAQIQATVSESLAAASVSSATVELRGPSGTIPANVTYDDVNKRITVTPTSPLTQGTQYSLVIHGGSSGITDVAGNPLASDYTSSFTTFTAGACPCSIWSVTTTPGTPQNDADTGSYELGMKFRSDMDGYVTGVRFYKGSGNTGTHLGHLWSSTGTMLAETTFKNETASGWQTATFSSPVAVKANTTYVVSYYDPNGRYAVDRPGFPATIDNGFLHALADGFDGGNGVFKSGTTGFPNKSTTQTSNYWVDLVFNTSGADTTPPSVLSTTPTAGATNVGLNQVATAQFDEALAPASVTSSSVQLSSPSGPVSATASFNASTNQLSITPTALLTPGVTYTALIRGGSGGVTDASGNALAANYTWSFTTYSCPCSIWPSTRVPSETSFADTTAYELGVKFRSDIPGFITGIRFYKGTLNTGSHLGHLWTSTGTMLGEAAFTSETASGWQQATFLSPIPIQANTTYIASYWDPNGYYALDRPYFTTGVDSLNLHALADGLDGPNGVFSPRAMAFPTKSVQQANYWVDVVFTP
jgi:hypothetical protein